MHLRIGTFRCRCQIFRRRVELEAARAVGHQDIRICVAGKGVVARFGTETNQQPYIGCAGRGDEMDASWLSAPSDLRAGLGRRPWIVRAGARPRWNELEGKLVAWLLVRAAIPCHLGGNHSALRYMTFRRRNEFDARADGKRSHVDGGLAHAQEDFGIRLRFDDADTGTTLRGHRGGGSAIRAGGRRKPPTRKKLWEEEPDGAKSDDGCE